MKKNTVNFILWFFSRYNKELYIDYSILIDLLSLESDKIIQVINYLEELEKEFDTDYINKWYFKGFFPYKYYGSYTGSFNLTEFLQYAVNEFEDFKDDIKNEIY